MKTYCEGSNCKKRDTCAKHNITTEGWYENIDRSTYGEGVLWVDENGKSRFEHWVDCGDDGGYKLYEDTDNL